MQFTVTAQELFNGANRCKSTNDQIQAQVTRMITYVDELKSTYTGTAAQALQQLTEQWGSSATQLNNVLMEIADGLTYNGNNYVKEEIGNAMNLSKIAHALPPGKF